ncbi:hypothetical protein [Ochrobactrum sp. SFR4]|uniref:hypothetical protein n=1 Tax=Ochrobactrum sp. SFR4 TaxID=2717368 RepID=UPI001C8B1381|nr:hypothetical protein [Ochrobactrum sp. SFR4]MBX8826890.1 hypothetical protein [Ochrobactrum sp. SFR4]
MAKEATRTGKTETLTIRLDPKSRFILDYLSRLKGQTITTLVERSIMIAADQERLQDYELGGTLTWNDFWDVSDGVRALKITDRREFFPTYEEEKRLNFCKEHWPFFWSTKDRTVFLNHYIDILWPNIDEYVQIHENHKANDYFGAGKAMQEALSKAKLKAPEWPVKPKAELQKKARDFDDGIPF